FSTSKEKKKVQKKKRTVFDYRSTKLFGIVLLCLVCPVHIVCVGPFSRSCLRRKRVCLLLLILTLAFVQQHDHNAFIANLDGKGVQETFVGDTRRETRDYNGARHRQSFINQGQITVKQMTPPLYALSIPAGFGLCLAMRFVSLGLQLYAGVPLKNESPRGQPDSKEVTMKDTDGYIRRTYAAHQNSWEAMILWTAAVLMAKAFGVDDGLMNTTAKVWMISRVV
ncbi:unnamed protein product, partial [Pylaiella littoralis]